IREAALPMREPFSAEPFNDAWSHLEGEVAERLRQAGIDPEMIEFERLVDMRYSTQVHEIATHAPGGSYDDVTLGELKQQFDRTYAHMFGEGSAYPAAGYAVAGVSVRGRAAIGDLPVADVAQPARKAATPAGERKVTWLEGSSGRVVDTAIYDG